MADLFDMTPPLPATGRFADVALERGVDLSPHGLTYAVPEELADLAVGDRVLAPLGRIPKPVPGYVVRLHPPGYRPTVPPKRLRTILRRDGRGIALTGDLLELAAWMARYYCTPLGMVFSTMLPAGVKRGAEAARHQVVTLTEQPPNTPAKLTPLQERVLAALRQWPDPQAPPSLKDLADAAGARSVAPIKPLLTKGLLQTHWRPGRQDDYLSRALAVAADTPIAENKLTSGQRAASAALQQAVAAQAFSVHLLHGVTGSGKTEVYLRAIAAIKAPDANPGLGVIVLVPEIALTPQTVGRFAARFGGGQVAVMHSGLTPGQRHEQWQRIRGGQVRLVVGTRLAVFAPFPKLGLVIVDEEHETSYKQDQLPRFHARDVAIKRAQLAGCPCVLGSATPSLESWANCTENREPATALATPPGTVLAATHENLRGEHARGFHLHSLPQRVGDLQLPRVELVDMTQERRKRYQMQGSAAVHALSLRLEVELRRTLKDGGQALLLLNRRGYAHAVLCSDPHCPWKKICDHCSVAMVWHRPPGGDRDFPRDGLLRCHHCQAEQLVPRVCPVCGKKIISLGLGTQRVEEELKALLPQARIARVDADTMRHGGDYHRLWDDFRAGELDILLGTQIIAKGIDHPNVRLVGVLSADTALHWPDFRSSERTFQLVAQVAGRAGRAIGREAHLPPSLVLVQTWHADDPTLQRAAAHDYVGFARQELALRREAKLPPATRMARLVCRDRVDDKARDLAQTLHSRLRSAAAGLGPQVRIMGPARCVLERLHEYYRWQIEVFAPDAVALQRLLGALREARLLKSDVHTAVDVDPVSFL